MTRPPASLLTLPHEIILAIFTLSSNPSLVLTCRELSQVLAPLSKSLATRIDFLLVRYRDNYVKAIVKGLRWAFFDLELLQAIDRLYSKNASRALEQARRRDMRHGSIIGVQNLSTIPGAADPSIPSTPAADSTIERPRKKRKKYHLPVPSIETDRGMDTGLETPSSSTHITEVQLPKDFPMPRRLFKSEGNMPLIRTLLSRGASPSHPSHYPLVRASQRGDVEMVRLLLSSGASPELKALRWACVEEQDGVVDVFLEYGVKPDGQCLSWCVENGKTRMTDRLLSMGVVPDLKTVLGF